MFLEKLSKIEERYKELEKLLSSPEVLKDRGKYQKYSKEHADLKPIITKYREYQKITKELKESRAMLAESKEEEMVNLAKAEIKELEEKEKKIRGKIETLLLPADPFDKKNILVEIRAGTGGEEAALFAANLLRMYSRYAEKRGWKVESISQNPTGLGGFKEVILGIRGKGAYSHFKYESGTHRVQRVPVTETSGRIHTSAATVAVLPEAEAIDIKMEEEDLRIDTYRASGPGGQHVQKTDSAVRITHKPTGLVVACQDERSQHQNKAKALRLLRSRVFELAEKKRRDEMAMARKIQIGTGDRSEKIRTYNFPQSRVTDHRIGFSLHNLDYVLDGNLDELIEALMAADRIAKLEKIKISKTK